MSQTSTRQPLRIRLAKKHTLAELEAMLHAEQDNPESKVGATGLDIYNAKVMKRMDEITWAMYYLRKMQNREEQEVDK